MKQKEREEFSDQIGMNTANLSRSGVAYLNIKRIVVNMSAGVQKGSESTHEHYRRNRAPEEIQEHVDFH